MEPQTPERKRPRLEEMGDIDCGENPKYRCIEKGIVIRGTNELITNDQMDNILNLINTFKGMNFREFSEINDCYTEEQRKIFGSAATLPPQGGFGRSKRRSRRKKKRSNRKRRKRRSKRKN